MRKVTVDEKLTERLAQLSSIELSAGECDALRSDLQRIISYVERLAQLDLEGVDAPGCQTRPCNVLAPDVPGPGLSRNAAFQNAPETHGLFFKAPPVIER